MSYFSIDESIENIKNSYTKDLFKEVYSSYSMGNYRSATVMLWSVVITDLVNKLKELDSVYADPKASQILQSIQQEQTDDPKSSKWELEIIAKFQTQLNFFETFEVSHLEHLQKMRHVSAHPVITSTDILYSPNKETVYSLMRNALESVLIKESLFSSQIIPIILKDLSTIKGTLVTFEDRQRYFVNKFLNKLPNILIKKLIKTLWKLAFKLENSETQANREIVLDVLKIILNKKKNVFLDFLNGEKVFISDLNLDDNLNKALLDFLVSNRFILSYFKEETSQTIYAIINSENSSKKYQIIKYENIIDYINYLKSAGNENFIITNLEIIKKECLENDGMTEFYDFCIFGYCQSRSFSEGDRTFDKLIRPNLDNFNIFLLRKLIERANSNDQCWARYGKSSDHLLVKTAITNLDPNFDFSPYANF